MSMNVSHLLWEGEAHNTDAKLVHDPSANGLDPFIGADTLCMNKLSGAARNRPVTFIPNPRWPKRPLHAEGGPLEPDRAKKQCAIINTSMQQATHYRILIGCKNDERRTSGR
jgi:hypothetical protein